MLQANIKRTVKKIVDDPEPTNKHLVLICVWQPGAKALYEEYRALVNALPEASNLEVMVVSREELMEKFHSTLQENEGTTVQMNRVCQNISMMEHDKTVHLFVDECWITVPKIFSPHMTQVCGFRKKRELGPQCQTSKRPKVLVKSKKLFQPKFFRKLKPFLVRASA